MISGIEYLFMEAYPDLDHEAVGLYIDQYGEKNVRKQYDDQSLRENLPVDVVNWYYHFNMFLDELLVKVGRQPILETPED